MYGIAAQSGCVAQEVQQRGGALARRLPFGCAQKAIACLASLAKSAWRKLRQAQHFKAKAKAEAWRSAWVAVAAAELPHATPTPISISHRTCTRIHIFIRTIGMDACGAFAASCAATVVCLMDTGCLVACMEHF